MRVTKSLSLMALIALAIAGGMDVRPANAMMALQQPQSRTLASLKSGLSNKMILPFQEPGETTVFFKGHITNNGLVSEGNSKGKMNLVLRIYDQADSGTKLYEGVHEVRVDLGQYTTDIQIPSETLANNKIVWLEAASVNEIELAFEPRYAFYIPPVEASIAGGVTPAASTSYYVKSVALCRHCGGDAPFINGQINTFAPTTEFGDGCANKGKYDDSAPYLCVGLGTF